MERETLEKYAAGELGAKRERYWNPQGTWPTDYKDPEQAPHRRPYLYWVGTVGGQAVSWEGEIGWHTRERAIKAARRFRDKCCEVLEEMTP